ncbi:MAG TPA: DUF1634 domain-containing protein [Thermoplasmata archaeon]|nr:DUF1634 domain-containing protein [Thermoplasmata archaeon]
MSAASAAPGPLPEAAYRRMTIVLRVGLGVALAILGGGLVAYLGTHPDATSAQALASNPILGYLGLSGLAAGLAAGSLEAYLTLGLLALLVTPILRVVTGIYFFRAHGERAMSAITLAVLALLLLALLVVGPLIR